MRRLSTTTRISLALASLTVSVLMLAQALGLLPDGLASALRGRKILCEAIAVQSSSAVFRGETESVRGSISAIASRNPEILSAAIRNATGQLLVEVGDHTTHWQPPPGDDSTPTHVRVPIFNGDARWGTVEIAFIPLIPPGFRGVLAHPLVQLISFTGVVGCAAFLLYLRKALQHLDPSLVIPERVKTMLDTLAEGVIVLDKSERIVLANEAFLRTVGCKEDALLGMKASKIQWAHPQHGESQQPQPPLPWIRALREGSVHTGISLCLKRGQEVQTFTVNAAPITGGGTSTAVRGALVTFDDMTPLERKNAQLSGMLEMLKRSRDEIDRQNQELQTLAMTDPLTGCLNRRAFFAQFETQWNSARRYGHVLSCVMVDVDHFKRINDQHGHATGDKVLQHVASILKSMARDSDLVGRYGGEEFCVLLTHTEVDGAAQAAERYREAIEKGDVGGVTLTASFGVSASDVATQSPQQLLNQADEALYAAKRAGRNRVERWSAELAGKSAHRGTTAAAGGASGEGGTRDDAGHEAGIPFRAVSALVSVLAHRDKATAAHSARVADLCVAVARDLLPAGECFVLEVAALLHDIGKLGVPDSILLKPGPLDDDEWKVMRKHDRMGAEIVAAAFGSEQLTRIVQSHHAWFGGTPSNPGLPRGEGIPVAARLLTIADAFDAMVSDRPYRKGQTQEQAFAELRKCAGTQFDPELVERVIRIIEERNKVRAAGAAVAPEQIVGTIQYDLARITQAMESQDLALLAAVAGRMSASAARDGLADVSRLAHELERSASKELDLEEVLGKINELVAICRAAEGTRGSGAAANPPGSWASFVEKVQA